MHRALQRGVTPEAEVAWLFKIAHNVCLTRRRSTRRRGRVESPSDLAAVQDVLPAPPREAPDDLIRLTDALERMPDNQRRAILLREWQGLSYHEIADELKLSQSAVETLIFRARRTLASKLVLEDEQPRRLARVRKAADVGMLLAAVKGLFEGGAAVKVAAAAVAASGAFVVATDPPGLLSNPSAPSAAHAAPASVAAAPVSSQPTGPAESAPVVEVPAAPAAHAPIASRACCSGRDCRRAADPEAKAQGRAQGDAAGQGEEAGGRNAGPRHHRESEEAEG